MLDDGAEDGAREDTGEAAGETDHHRFAQELREHVVLRRADGSPHTDLPDALEDRREHDIHDPDAADDERDRRDGAEDDVEDRLRPLLLLEQQLGHGNLEVDDLVVPAGEKPTDNIRHLWNSGGSIHLHDDLVELIVVSLLGALIVRFGRVGLAELPRRELHLLLCHLAAIAIAEEHCRQRDIHIHVCVADAQPLGCLGGDLAIFQYADDGQPLVSDLYGSSDRLFGREEA